MLHKKEDLLTKSEIRDILSESKNQRYSDPNVVILGFKKTSIFKLSRKSGLIYAGTDDGIIQVTEDGGKNWRKVDFSTINGLLQIQHLNSFLH